LLLLLLLLLLLEVVDLEEVAVADIAAGGWHSMALSADGQIYVWGRWGGGQGCAAAAASAALAALHMS
jgi:alpha-tubulin suppressor-like RCC1 family protein